MKLKVARVFLLIIVLVLMLGFVLPYAFSAPSTELVLLGVTGIVLMSYITIILICRLIKKGE